MLWELSSALYLAVSASSSSRWIVACWSSSIRWKRFCSWVYWLMTVSRWLRVYRVSSNSSARSHFSCVSVSISFLCEDSCLLSSRVVDSYFYFLISIYASRFSFTVIRKLRWLWRRAMSSAAFSRAASRLLICSTSVVSLEIRVNCSVRYYISIITTVL